MRRHILALAVYITALAMLLTWDSPQNSARAQATHRPAYAYTLTVLPTLGGDNGEAIGLNNAGEIVGAAQDANAYIHAFTYAHGKLTDIGGYGSTIPSAINSHGVISGTASYDNQDTQGVVYRHGRWHSYLHRSCNSDANWITNSGHVGGSSCYEVPGGNEEQKASTWIASTRSVKHSVNQLSDVFSLAPSGDSVGVEAGFDDLGNLQPHAYYWGADGHSLHLHTLGLPGALAYSLVEHGNNVTAVGGALSNLGEEQSVLWKFNRDATVPPNPIAVKGFKSMPYSVFTDINAKGEAVGGASDGYDLDAATVWTKASGMLNLNHMVKHGSFNLDFAEAVNDSGVIVGAGYEPDGTERGFILTPTGAALRSNTSNDTFAVRHAPIRQFVSVCHGSATYLSRSLLLPSAH